MAKKKRQKLVRIVRTKNNKWVFRTELGVVIATFLASFVLMFMQFPSALTGNVIGYSFNQGISSTGAVLFVLGIIEAFALITNRRK